MTLAVPGLEGAGQKIEETFFSEIFRDIADPAAVLVPNPFRQVIEINPRRCEGQPCFRGTGISVFVVHELKQRIASAATIIRDYYPILTKESINVGENYVRYLAARRL